MRNEFFFPPFPCPSHVSFNKSGAWLLWTKLSVWARQGPKIVSLPTHTQTHISKRGHPLKVVGLLLVWHWLCGSVSYFSGSVALQIDRASLTCNIMQQHDGAWINAEVLLWPVLSKQDDY